MALTTPVGTEYLELIQNFTTGAATVETDSDSFELGNAQAANEVALIWTDTTIASTVGPLTIHLEDSPDDSTWAEISGTTEVIEIASVLTIDTEFARITVPAQIDRYVKVVFVAANASEATKTLDITATIQPR